MVSVNPTPAQGFPIFDHLNIDLPGFDSSLPVSERFGLNPIDTMPVSRWSNRIPFSEDSTMKIRKPYTMKKLREHWTDQEHDKFLEALHLRNGRENKQVKEKLLNLVIIMFRETPCDILVKQIKEGNPDSHIFKVENFSLLKKYQIKQVESSVFSIFGRRWKLILHPDGNEKDNGKGHVSLYLEFQDSKQVAAYFQLFILNQLKIATTSQEGYMEFDNTNNKWGATKLITIDNLNDSKEGYLMGDCSIFGVKFYGFPVPEPAKAESFSLIEKPPRNKVTWKMAKYSAFNPETDHMSHEFIIGNRKWRLQVFPRGDLNAKGKYLSVNLLAKGFMDNTPKTKTYAKYTLRVLNQKDGVHRIKTESNWFSEEDCSFGWSQFMSLRDLNWGYLVDNKLCVGVEMAVVSTAKYS